MKKIVPNLLRYILIFVALIAGCICAVSITGIIIASSAGIYSNELKESLDNGRKNLSGIYSRYIFENMKENGNPGCMEQSNLQYVIVRGINPDEDIDSKANTAVINNDDNIVYTSNSLYGQEPDEFYYENYKIFNGKKLAGYGQAGIISSLFDDGGRQAAFDNYKSYKEYVQRIFYQDGIFYFETGHYAFPAYSVEVPATRLSNPDYKMLEEEGYISGVEDYVIYELEYNKDGKPFYRCPWLYNVVLDTLNYQDWDRVLINNISFQGKAVKKGKPGKGIEIFKWDKDKDNYVCDIEDEGSYAENTKGYPDIDYLNIAITYEIEDKTYSDVYAIFTNVASPLDKNADDLFYTQKRVIKFLYEARYPLIAIAVISAVVFIMLLMFCCYSRYIYSDNDSVRKNWFHRMPFLIYTSFIALIFTIIIAIGTELLSGPVWYVQELKLLAVLYFFVALWFMACIFLFIMFCMETSCRLGAGILFKTTVLYFIYSILVKIFSSLKDAYIKTDRNTSLFIKSSLVLVLMDLLLLSGFLLNALNGNGDNGELVLFFIAFAICAVFDFFVLKSVLQMEALQIHAREMAAGSLESKTDTSKMAWEFKKHGEYLNQISEGMVLAVDEKIKSEHFKTELITNVSHDIKTPLTSIINYVDLLKKENIPQPEAQEYIEVLDRQSARLKKLIEDLMEASKVSTGNVTVNFELCDINILLTQTLGEFEEKLNNKDLELIINKSMENIFIMADNRHIWRIFDNLMNNICKYGQPGTRVYINIETEDENVIIIFRNTSSYPLNISSDELLERFVRGDASRHTEGSGLGLSIAQNLAEIMGGSLKLHVDGDLFKVVLGFPRTMQP